MNEPLGKVLLVYFVADESKSMESVVGELNHGLTVLLDTLHTEPFAASKVRVAILGFSDTTTCYLEPSDLRELTTMPKLGAYNSTSYESAFCELFRRIPQDVISLKAKGYLVHRPTVFFLSDGVPNGNENWRDALRKLKSNDFRERPNILAFGIGEADPKIISEVASKENYAWVTAKGADVGKAVANVINLLTNSIVNSAHASDSGANVLPVEQPNPEDFKLAIDLL